MATPKGIILIWHNDTSTIPVGWVICDGNNDTPDMRRHFVYGASSDGEVGTTSGSNIHSHSSLPSLDAGGAHTHSKSGNTNGSDRSSSGQSTAGAYSKATSHSHSYSLSVSSGGGHTHTVSGASGNANTEPPYLKLFYIMKT